MIARVVSFSILKKCNPGSCNHDEIDKLNWSDLKYFLAVARTGSLTAASELLNSSPATVSRRLSELEADLGIKLFSRHASGYLLTDDGSGLVDRAEAAESAMIRVERAAAGRSAAASGQVRVATAENIANYLIIPALSEFNAQFPEVVLEIHTGVRSVNLTRREADIALTMRRPRQGNVLVKKIGELGYGVYGTKDLAARFSKNPADVGAHADYIGWAEEYGHLDIAEWAKELFKQRAPSFVTHSLRGQLIGAKEGLGLAILPCLLGASEPSLIEVKGAMKRRSQDIWLVTHKDLRHSMRVVAVFEFLEQLIRNHAKALSGKN